MSLRGLLEKDADGMLEWMNDPEIRKNFRFGAESRDKNDVMNFIKEASVELIEGKSIHYAIVDEKGPDHNKVFVAEVTHEGKVLGQGSGKSKKEAEQNAANAALKKMNV